LTDRNTVKAAGKEKPEMSRTDAAGRAFLREAERELAELMAEVAGADVRHGPKRRTHDQERDLLEAELGAVRLPHAELTADLEALDDYEPEDDQEAASEMDARFMRQARRELATLIRDVEGPRPRQAPRRPE
jgi:hypothetical protein